ncbi:glycosyltransferase [Paenibacillus oceani]|uniref:Glycosyltransferase n=1 Tax=Paenibacillus oceani TaxID=2772510 RepID=A0A927CC95_9BACL|nr:glycosyltransferase [Paenibacillus oceani]MBD2864804.1 glycosyltransferase [Paenibacillus oceani]
MDKTNVLAYSFREIPSATVGVIKPLKTLMINKIINFRYANSLQVSKEDILWADVVICIRGTEAIELKIIEECRRIGKFTIYFLDDDLLSVPKTANSFDYFNMEAIQNNIKVILSNCALLWTTNSNIQDKYKRFTNDTIVIDAPALLIDTMPVFNGKDKPIRIGFAGGIDHNRFLNTLLEPVIRNIIEKYSDSVQIEFFGARPDFIKKNDNIHHIPFADDYSEYVNVIKSREWDIGLAPLEDSEFHKCKYFNKYLEYGAIGAAGIYSNHQPFTFIVKDGFNGVLVENTIHEWTIGIERLIENPKLRQSIREQSYIQLKDSFTVEKIAITLTKYIVELTTYRAPLILEKDIRYKKVSENTLLYKIKAIIKAHGTSSFGIIMKKIYLKIKNKIL